MHTTTRQATNLPGTPATTHTSPPPYPRQPPADPDRGATPVSVQCAGTRGARPSRPRCAEREGLTPGSVQCAGTRGSRPSRPRCAERGAHARLVLSVPKTSSSNARLDETGTSQAPSRARARVPLVPYDSHVTPTDPTVPRRRAQRPASSRTRTPCVRCGERSQ